MKLVDIQPGATLYYRTHMTRPTPAIVLEKLKNGRIKIRVVLSGKTVEKDVTPQTISKQPWI